MKNLYVSKVRTICKQIDSIEEQIVHLKSQNPHNSSQITEYERALNDKIAELLSLHYENEDYPPQKKQFCQSD